MYTNLSNKIIFYRFFFFFSNKVTCTFAHKNLRYPCTSEIPPPNLSLEPANNNYTFISPLLSLPHPLLLPHCSLSLLLLHRHSLFSSLILHWCFPLPQSLRTRSFSYLRVCVSLERCLPLVFHWQVYRWTDAQILCSNLPHGENRR